MSSNSLKKILVIQTASIGDVILATPVLEKLHYDHPEAKIDFLVKQGMEGLFAGHPFLNRLLVWNKRNGKFRNLFILLRTIRKNRYDRVINLQRFASTGILTAFSGAAHTTGFDKNPFSRLFTEQVHHEIGTGVHEANRNLLMAGASQGDQMILPRLYPTPADRSKTAIFKTVPYYTIAPASLWFTKQYPAEKWVDLIRRIPPAVKVYLTGSEHDIPLCESIKRISGHPGVMILSGKLSFLESASLMEDATMNFTNDSAPMHLASAVNAPVTVVYCSTVPAFGFGPLSADSAVVEHPGPLTCRPCGLHGYRSCPEDHFRCAMEIPTEDLARRL